MCPNEIKSASSPVRLDDVLLKLNIFGRYYVGFLCMISLIFIFDTLTCAQYIFTADKVNYWCADKRFGNDSCASLSNSTDVCAEWVYEDPHSFVAEFDLACQEWKRTLVGTAQVSGYGIGLLMIGPLSDRIGRKPTIISTAIICGIIGVARSFANHYWLFIVLEFLGACLGNCYSPAYILLLEMVAHEKRVLSKTLTSLAQSVMGYLILSLAAWQVPYWRHLLLAIYSPAIIFVLFMFLLDESPRWLLNKGKKDEAIAILRKATESCKTELNINVLDDLTHEQRDEVGGILSTLKATFKSNILFKRLFVCIVLWTVTVFANFGIKVNSVLLPGNKYVNFGLLGIVAVPGRIITYWLLKTYSRKISLIVPFLLCSIVYFVQAFVPENTQWLSISLFMAGMLLVRIFFAVIYIFTSELFPTYTRNSMLALCSSVSRIGSVLAMQTPLLIVYWHGLPSLTFGAASLVGSAVALLTPSTFDDTLPDTVNQAELIGQKQLNNANFTDNVNLPEITKEPSVYTIKLRTDQITDRSKKSY